MTLWDKITGKKPEEEPPKPLPDPYAARRQAEQERAKARATEQVKTREDRKEEPGPAVPLVKDVYPRAPQEFKTEGEKTGQNKTPIGEREPARLEKTHNPGPQKVPDIRGGFKAVNNRARPTPTKQEAPPPPPKPPIKSFKELHPDDDKTPKR